MTSRWSWDFSDRVLLKHKSKMNYVQPRSQGLSSYRPGDGKERTLGTRLARLISESVRALSARIAFSSQFPAISLDLDNNRCFIELTSIRNSHSAHRNTSQFDVFERQKFKPTVAEICWCEFGQHTTGVWSSNTQAWNIIGDIFNGDIIISFSGIVQ